MKRYIVLVINSIFKTEDISSFTKELAGIFNAEHPSNLIWKYSDEPNEKHNTIFRATKEKAIIWTLNETE